MKPSTQPQTSLMPNMKTPPKSSSQVTLTRIISSKEHRGLALVMTLSLVLAANAADFGKGFSTAEEAATALTAATTAKDFTALGVLFGPAGADLENPDRVQATNDLSVFTTALNQTNRLVHESDSRCVLEVGADFWPFPVPIVKKDGQWFFDAEAGKQEILSRRIGKNELATLQVVRAYVDAQRDYASRDRDGDDVLEYAQKLSSSPGQKDGLYWPPDLDGEVSPLGPLVAQAQSQGYALQGKETNAEREPFHGYYFKILTRQGKHAPGGKYDYIINGNMIGGFALVAWPAEYGESGIMTFIVNQQGQVYQKDLGAKTGKLAPAMKTYDPDPSWSISPD